MSRVSVLASPPGARSGGRTGGAGLQLQMAQRRLPSGGCGGPGERSAERESTGLVAGEEAGGGGQ